METVERVERAISGLFIKQTKSNKALCDMAPWPADAAAYELLEDCGRGVSATVYRAYCIPREEIVAVKKLNLETIGSNLDEVVHEAQVMKNYNHPNILPLHTSFVDGTDLWMVMPFVSGGSVLHIIKFAHPEGLEEVVIATIMRDVLKALDYVHRQGGIHRDIKAGNILVNQDGSVRLADFGVATSMDRKGSWGHGNQTRMTFVGTPCWMAPEVMEQTSGYDNAADIWSFGIAMLEMAHGHAPFAKYPPMKVLLMTLQNPPPSLEDKGKKHFSKAMRDVVTRCLQKDPRNRPAASQLLEHKFFKQARDEEYLAKYLMAGLPSLGDRVQQIRQGKAATLGSDNERNFARSQEEYIKGVSSWNFDLASLKAQADLEPDEMLPTIKEDDGDMTLTGIDRSVAADFVAATLQAGVQDSNTNGGTSVFATRNGQAATASIVSVSPITIELNPTPEPQPVMSPVGTRSPSGTVPASREGSQALQSLASTSKLKTKGRFTVHDDGEVQAPLSTSASSPFLSGKDWDVGANGLTRDSEDGSTSAPFKKEDRSVTFGEPVMLAPAPTEEGGLEPKKKGRFTVIENNAAAAPQPAALDHKTSMEVARDMAAAPAAGTGPGRPASTVGAALLPKLQELLDHAAIQQAAMQKLLVAVQETERTGKLQPGLRAPLFEAPCEADSVEELRAVVEQLQLRLAEVEADNTRLRSRNTELEVKARDSTALAALPNGLASE